jgi:predicted ribosomally synthesized peptide with nif11-like leader
MSEKSLNDFYKATQSDAALQQKLKAAPDKDSYLNLIVQSGKERGYDFTRQDVVSAFEASNAKRTGGSKELDDQQLESVAGGFAFLERWYYDRFTSGKVKCS